jgi:hypothetical protein
VFSSSDDIGTPGDGQNLRPIWVRFTVS